MKKFILFLLFGLFFVSNSLKAKDYYSDEGIKQLIVEYYQNKGEQVKEISPGDSGRFKACFIQCMMNSCSYCDGEGSCANPPCLTPVNCSTCNGTCTVYEAPAGPSCALICVGRAIINLC